MTEIVQASVVLDNVSASDDLRIIPVTQAELASLIHEGNALTHPFNQGIGDVKVDVIDNSEAIAEYVFKALVARAKPVQAHEEGEGV